MTPTSKQRLGQFFTVDPQIQRLVRDLTTPALGGQWLEPSAGAGDLVTRRDEDTRPLVLVEYDPTWAAQLPSRFPTAHVLPGCFFAAALQPGQIGSAIGNPPYVAWTTYRSGASAALQQYVAVRGFGGKTNLVYPFLDRVAHLLAAPGEMIMVVPKDFSTATSARPLREYLAAHGVFTHWVDAGETPHFPDAQLESLVIFRWEKRTTRPAPRPAPAPTVRWAGSVADAVAGRWQAREEIYSGADQQLLMLHPGLATAIGPHTLGDVFDVCVSSVTGYDAAFRTPPHLAHLPQAQLFQTSAGAPVSMLNTNALASLETADPALVAHLQQHRAALEARYGVDPTRWWHWATLRNPDLSLRANPAKPRLFVLSQTRKAPFFVGARIGFVGSVYALFPKASDVTDAELTEVARLLNSPLYREIYQAGGLGVRDKFRCTPRALQMLPLPPRAQWSVPLQAP